jgi:hypothetical protein
MEGKFCGWHYLGQIAICTFQISTYRIFNFIEISTCEINLIIEIQPTPAFHFHKFVNAEDMDHNCLYSC